MPMYDGAVRIKINGDDTNFQKAINSTSQSLGNLKGLIVKLGLGAVLAKGMKEAVVATNALEDSIAKASTLFGDTQVNVKGLNDQIKSLSASTGISADKIGNSLYNALSAGVAVTEDMGEAMRFMESSAKLSIAGFTDIDNTVQATAKVLNAYGKEAISVEEISKVLMNTQNLGITTVDQLGSALATVTPVASAFGLSFQEVGASLAVMTKAGTDTATATTQLRALLNALAQSDTKASKALAEATKRAYGQSKSFKDLTKEGVNLQEMLRLMEGYAKESGISLMDLFGEVRAGTGALQIASDATATYNKFIENMASDADVVAEAYDKVMGTRSKQWELLGSRLKNITIKITESEGVQKLLDNITTLAENIVTKIEDWAPAIRKAMNVIYVTGSATFAYLGTLIDKVRNSAIIKPVLDFSKEAWESMGKDMQTALAVGLGIGAFLKSPALGVLTFSIIGTLTIVKKIREGIDQQKAWSEQYTGTSGGGTSWSATPEGDISKAFADAGAWKRMDIKRALTNSLGNTNKEVVQRLGKDIGKDVLNGIIKGLGYGNKLEDVSEEQAQLIVDKFKDVLDIHSPSKVFEEIGNNVIAGLVEGISTQSNLDSAMDSVTQAFMQFGQDLNGAIREGLDLSEIVSEIAKATELYNTFTSKIGAMTPATGNSGGNLIADTVAKFKNDLLAGFGGGTSPASPDNSSIFMQGVAESMGGVLEAGEGISDLFTNLVDKEGQLTEKGQMWADVFAGALSTVSSGIEGLGEALVSGGDGWNAFAKAGLNALADLIRALGMQLMASAWTTFPPNFGQLAMATTALVGAGVVRGLANKFEQGGIVGGSGYTGDRHMIWANAGELILNRAQQRSIAGQLASPSSGNTIHIDFSGQVFGDQQSIAEYVYDGIRTAQNNGVIGSWQ